VHNLYPLAHKPLHEYVHSFTHQRVLAQFLPPTSTSTHHTPLPPPQTDSGDLLGGFKPVEARDALGPLLLPFTDLIRRTWTKWVCVRGAECVWGREAHCMHSVQDRPQERRALSLRAQVLKYSEEVCSNHEGLDPRVLDADSACYYIVPFKWARLRNPRAAPTTWNESKHWVASDLGTACPCCAEDESHATSLNRFFILSHIVLPATVMQSSASTLKRWSTFPRHHPPS